ncbi:MAG: RNA methyltransferase [Nitrosomonas sp.]|nr:MAG: RNA methyltransferase [Nitrosomonas sp.]
MMKFDGTITHLSQKGLGVVKNTQNNMSYFVYGTWPGDRGEFEVTDKPLHNKKFGYAKLVRLIQSSPQRQTPPCPHTGPLQNACTGCPWMIADYASQLEQKQNRFRYAMQRVGFDAAQLPVKPIHPAPQLYGYRNRCQLKTDGAQLGFISEDTHQIAPIQDCIVLNDACRRLLQSALEQLPNPDWQSDSDNNRHSIELDDEMQPDAIRINRERAFKQGNTQQNTWMQAWLQQQLARCSHPDKAVELFCGSGNFTSVIAAANCTSVLAYEADADAVARLETRKLAKVRSVVIDLFDPRIWKKLKNRVGDARTLVLDPPRAGLKKHQGFFDSFTALKTIIYISCNPETFARDAWFFKQHGFLIDEIQLIDLFPHTPHVEVLAVFQRR